MTFEDFLSNVLVVVVLYKKKISESESLLSVSNALVNYNFDVFLYDNSPEYNLTHTEIFRNCRIHYIADCNNSGVSKAYNQGAILAHNLNKDWMLLCDHDTSFTRSYFDHVFDAIQVHNPPLIAPFLFSNSILISPCGFTFNYGYSLKKQPKTGLNYLKNISLLNSGLFIKFDAFKECGGFNELVFLDFSDFDFLKKFRKKYKQFYLLDVKIEHHLESSFQGNFDKDRYIIYCKSYRAAIHGFFDLISISMIVFSRAIKLTIKYRIADPLMCISYFFLKR